MGAAAPRAAATGGSVGSRAAAEKTGDMGDPKRLPPLRVCTGGEKQRHLQSNEIATTVF